MTTVAQTQTLLEMVIAAIEQAGNTYEQHGIYHVTRCPCTRNHAHGDEHPSLNFWEALDYNGNDTIAFNCWSGCSRAEILAGLNLSNARLPKSEGTVRRAAHPTITMFDLAREKLIDHRFLFNLGVTDGVFTFHRSDGTPYRVNGVKIPYFVEGNQEYERHKIRTGLHKVTPKDNIWYWSEEDVPIIPYGIDRLQAARDAGYLVIVEGESDCWTLWLHGFPALGVPGAKNESVLTGELLRGIPRIYIMQEKTDQAGQNFPFRVQQQLARIDYQGEIRRLPLRTLTGDKDPNEMHQRLFEKENPHTPFREAFQRVLEQAVRMDYDTGKQEECLPSIILGKQLRDIRHDALDALMLKEQHNPKLFLQQGKIKRVERDEKQRPLISEVEEAQLRSALTDAADFFRQKEKSDALVLIPVSPPKDLVQEILGMEAQKLPFPALETIVQTPVLRKDGTILDTPGYDCATHLYYMPEHGLAIPAIPQNPTQQQAQEAMHFINGLIADFPWEGCADRANALALLLTTVTRQMFKHVPMGLVDATKQGTGKGLYTDVVNIIATGRGASALSPGCKDEELDKRITALLLEGDTVITIDNEEGVMRSPILAKILTSEYHKGRVLGLTKMVDVPQRAIWIANGNNMQVGGDMARRSYRMRMITQVSNPDAREDFAYPDLAKTVRERRGEIIASLLIIARAWFAAGCPAPAKKLRKLATFTPWCETIGGMLAYAGITGFLENVEVLRKEADVDGNAWTQFLETWLAKLGDQEYKTADIIAQLNQDKAFAETLPEPLGTMYLKEDKSLSRKLGRILAKQNGTPYGPNNLRIVKEEDAHAKVATFKVAGYSKSTQENQAQNAGYAGYAGIKTSHAQGENSHSENGHTTDTSLNTTMEGESKNDIGHDLNLNPQTTHTPQGEHENEKVACEYPAKCDTDGLLKLFRGHLQADTRFEFVWDVPESVGGFVPGTVFRSIYLERVGACLKSEDPARREAAITLMLAYLAQKDVQV